MCLWCWNRVCERACVRAFMFIVEKWHSQILPDPFCDVGEYVCFLRVAGNYYHSFMYINYAFCCSPQSLPADARQSFVRTTIVFMLNHCHRSWSSIVFSRKACGNMSFSSQILVLRADHLHSMLSKL